MRARYRPGSPISHFRVIGGIPAIGALSTHTGQCELGEFSDAPTPTFASRVEYWAINFVIHGRWRRQCRFCIIRTLEQQTPKSSPGEQSPSIL
jgi:hypothetical protein